MNKLEISDLQFDGKDSERFKDNKEYKDMTEWKEAGGSTDDTWDKKEPIQGILKNIKTNVGPNASNMYVLKVGDKEVGIWGSTVLDSRFEDIPAGSEVRVESLGTATGKNGKEYANYRVQYREVPMVDAKDVEGLEGII